MHARVLFVDPKTKKIALTALPHLVALSGASPLLASEPIALGATLDGVVAQRMAGVGLQLTLNAAPRRVCFVHASNVADRAREESAVEEGAALEDDAYAPGAAHAVRIIGSSALDGSLVGSMRASVLANPIISLGDVRPGMRLRGRITRVAARVLHVLLADGVRGTVALSHMADVVVRNAETRFKVHQIVGNC